MIFMKSTSKFFGLIAALLISVGCASVSHEQPTTDAALAANNLKEVETIQKVSKQVMVDTDMAIDDWTALLYILSQRDTDIIAITITGAGEVFCEEGMRNALHLIEVANRADDGITVACGDSEPLDGYNVFPAPWRNDANTLVGLPISENLPQPSKKHAVRVLQDILNNSDEKIDIITLGNLTNIAQLLMIDAGAAAKIKTLFVMGGAFNVKGNIIVPGFTQDNLNKVAEWNIYIDPVAAQIVFDSQLDMVVIPLDATNKVMVTHEFAREFEQKARSNSAKFKAKILERNRDFISSNEYFFWDPLTAVVAFHPDLCKFEQHPIQVNTDTADSAGPNEQASYSSLRFDGKKRNILSPMLSGKTSFANSDGSKKPAHICVQPAAERFKKLLITGLNS